MSLADWQISLLSASVGTAIPLVFVLGREMYTERKRKNQLRNVVSSELLLAREALSQALKTGKTDKGFEDGLLVSNELPVYESFPLDTTFYDDTPIETLATNVSIEAMKSLRLTYNMIYRFNSKRLLLAGGNFWTEKSLVTNLINQIDKTVKLINDC